MSERDDLQADRSEDLVGLRGPRGALLEDRLELALALLDPAGWGPPLPLEDDHRRCRVERASPVSLAPRSLPPQRARPLAMARLRTWP